MDGNDFNRYIRLDTRPLAGERERERNCIPLRTFYELHFYAGIYFRFWRKQVSEADQSSKANVTKTRL